MLKTIRNFFNGMAFGITETVPGVSGGTIAIILGFYFDLIRSINNFAKSPKTSLRFLIPLLFGVIAGILLFSSVMRYLLEQFAFPTMLLFIGLIVGIIPHIFSKVAGKGRKFGAKEIILVIIPFPVLLILANLGDGTVKEPEEIIANIDFLFMLFIFFAGILAAMALVIPGTSGSFILLVLGIYPVVIYSVSSIRIFLADVTNTALLFDILKVLVPLALGVIIGGLSMVRLIERLLKNHEKTVFSIILGLLSASVVVLFMEPMAYKNGLSLPIVIAGIATLTLGCITSFNLWKKGI
jgi:putative membrane protein